jgi:hypothetical protein
MQFNCEPQEAIMAAKTIGKPGRKAGAKAAKAKTAAKTKTPRAGKK